MTRKFEPSKGHIKHWEKPVTAGTRYSAVFYVLPPREKDPLKDYWIYEPDGPKRNHRKFMRARFTPTQAGFPENVLRRLRGKRVTHCEYAGEDAEVVKDKWNSSETAHKVEARRWTGSTKFFYKTPVEHKSVAASARAFFCRSHFACFCRHAEGTPAPMGPKGAGWFAPGSVRRMR